MENTYNTRTKPKMNECFFIIGPHLNNQLFKIKYISQNYRTSKSEKIILVRNVSLNIYNDKNHIN